MIFQLSDILSNLKFEIDLFSAEISRKVINHRCYFPDISLMLLSKQIFVNNPRVIKYIKSAV